MTRLWSALLTCPVRRWRGFGPRLSRGDDRLWLLLCLAAEVPQDAERPQALDRLIAAGLKVSANPVRIAATSADIRLRTYRALSVLESAGSAR